MNISKFIPVILATALFSCNNSSKDENKTQADTTKTVVEEKPKADAPSKEMHVKAQFVKFEMGDASHFEFKDESGKELDFGNNEDSTAKFAIELPKGKANSSNQGWDANKELLNKWFNLTYVTKKEPLYTDGPMGDVMTITKAEMVK